MKKVIFILFAVVLFVSCESPEQVKEDIDALRKERTNLESSLRNTIHFKDQLALRVDNLNEELRISGMIKEGKTPRYVLKLRMKQSHMSLDLMKHAKDEMNVIEFEMPVDKEFYESISVGDNLVDEFRKGSLFTEGSFGSWKVTVTSKRVL